MPVCECHPRIKSRDAYAKYRAKSQACQGLSQAYTLMSSVALVSQLFTLTQQLILTHLTEDWGSYLVEEVTEDMCVEKSLKWEYLCIIRAGSRRVALILLHPLPLSDSWVGGSFSEQEGSLPWRISQLFPALSFWDSSGHKFLQQLWNLSLGSREKVGSLGDSSVGEMVAEAWALCTTAAGLSCLSRALVPLTTWKLFF